MTRKMNNFVCMTLAVCVYIVCTIQGEWCEQTYLSRSGLTCSFCAPGTYKVRDCEKNFTGALCMPCPKNTYQKICNRAESCAKCDRRCKVRYKKVKDCTINANIICKCKDGYFEKNGMCTKSSTAKESTGNHAYKPTQRTEWYNSSTVHRQNSPTQTTEWYTDSSTVHSSTANMPKHTTECYCSGGFKVIFIVLITLISLTLLILLACVFIYVSGKGEQVQELWKNKRQAGPTPDTSQTGENGSDSTPTSGTSLTGENRVNDSTPTSGTSPTGENRVTDSTPETGPPPTRENSNPETGTSTTGQNRGSRGIQERTTSQQGQNSLSGRISEGNTSQQGPNSNLSSHQTEDSHDESGNEPSATTPLLNGQQAEQINLSYSNPRNSGQKIGRSLEPTQTGQEINKGDADCDLPDNSCPPMVSLSSKEKVQGNR